MPFRNELVTIGLLFCSNIFMTFAWYGHLKQKDMPMIMAVVVSWGIAFLEYCFQVPANRIGHQTLSAPQLKVIQEVITFIVFAVFSAWYLKEDLTWHDKLAFSLIVVAAIISLYKPRLGA